MKHIESTYKINNIDIKDLLFKFDFHKYSDCLVHSFPVYRYNNRPVIYGEFVVYADENILHVNATDMNNNHVNYNNEEYGKSRVIKTINENINKEIEKFAKEGLILLKQE